MNLPPFHEWFWQSVVSKSWLTPFKIAQSFTARDMSYRARTYHRKPDQRSQKTPPNTLMITQSSSCVGSFWFPGSCCYRTDHISKDGCSLLAPRLRQRASRCSQLPTSSRKEIGVCTTKATRGHSQRMHWHFGLLGSVSNSTTGLLLGCFVPVPWQHWPIFFFFKACCDLCRSSSGWGGAPI